MMTRERKCWEEDRKEEETAMGMKEDRKIALSRQHIVASGSFRTHGKNIDSYIEERESVVVAEKSIKTGTKNISSYFSPEKIGFQSHHQILF